MKESGPGGLNPHNPETKRDAWFNEKWAHPKEIDVAGEKLGMYDISPEHQKSEVPVLIMDGWGSTPTVWKDNVETLVETGRRTICVNVKHGVESNIEQPEDMEEIPEAELRRITAFMAALDASQVEKADVIAHSEGGLDALLAAYLYPDRFRNLVLVSPGGMIGADNFVKLSARFAYDTAKSHIQALRDGTLKKLLAIGNEVTPTVAKAPIRSVKQIDAVARANVVHLLREVKERGVNIIVISGVDDKVFPTTRMAETISAEKEEGEDIQKILDGFYSVKGAHAEFIVKAPQYTKVGEGAISALEARDAKRLNSEK